jgi:methyl-accepting chemotaxis protein
MKKLSSKIALVLALSMILILVGTVGIIFKSNYDAVEKSIAGYSEETAKSISKSIDVEKYGDFLKNKSETDTYWELRKNLNRVREDTGALYVYTLGVNEENVFILVDGLPRDSDIASDIGTPTTTTKYEDIESALNGKPSSIPIVHDEKYGDYLSAFVPIKDSNDKVIGVLGVDVDAGMVKAITSDVNKSVLPFTITVIIMMIGLIVGFLTWYLRRRLKPLQLISKASEEMASGNLQQALHTVNGIKTKGKDEIPQLVGSFKLMTDNTINMVNGIKDSAGNLLSASNHIETGMELLSSSSSEVVQGIQQVAVATDSQLQTSADSVRAIEEMAIGIQRIAEAASGVSESSITVSEQVKGGFTEIQDIITQIEGIKNTVNSSTNIVIDLGGQADEIKMIVDIISGISEQTNLLALNAAIEAARAGEQGKGFAVVSQEVRKLAEESKKSATKIADLLNRFRETFDEAVITMNKSAEEVEKGTKAIHNTGKKFTHVLHAVESVSAEIEEVSAITEEMSASTEEISSSIEDFANMLNGTAKISREVATSTDQQAESINDITGFSVSLKTLSHKLEQSIQKFNI